jgi:hypothetical protein
MTCEDEYEAVCLRQEQNNGRSTHHIYSRYEESDAPNSPPKLQRLRYLPVSLKMLRCPNRCDLDAVKPFAVQF